MSGLSLGLGVGLTRRGGGGAASFWTPYLSSLARLHDANESASLSTATGSAVTSWLDMKQGLAPYVTQAGGGITVGAVGSQRYVNSSGLAGMVAASNTNLRGTDTFILLRIPATAGLSVASSATTSPNARVDVNTLNEAQLLASPAPYSAPTANFLKGGSLTPGTWHVFRVTLTETSGAKLYVNGSLVNEVFGTYGGSDPFDVSGLFTRQRSSPVDAAFAVIAVFEGVLGTDLASSLSASLIARRDILRGV